MRLRFNNEPDTDELLRRLSNAESRMTSPLAFWEAAVALSRELGVEPDIAEGIVSTFLDRMDIVLLIVPATIGSMALDAYHRYGKGRHPAALNFGDCFAYANARHQGVPLLCKGNDFVQTDIETA